MDREEILKAVKERANLCGADLCGADLYGANLCGADLCGANLCGANLRGANLYGANLCGANLRGANLRGADLCGAKNIPIEVLETTNILAEGKIFGYKKLAHNVVIKISIPAKAKRSNANTRKCRAEYAKVEAIVSNPENVTEFVSQRDSNFKYVVGKIVRPDVWCEDRWNECAGGIHFFLTQGEAERY